jgi:spermidine/putrescine transport system substrate-binding protein
VADEPTSVDPSWWRGLTEKRWSRRSAIGIGAVGVMSLVLFTGNSSAPSGGPLPNADVGTASWWAKQSLHKKLNWANWSLYIDTLNNGSHPSLTHLQQTTGIVTNYAEVVNDDGSFYLTIRPSLEAGQYCGYDLVVMTNNTPHLGYLIEEGWLVPIDRSMMTNFNQYAGPLVKNPSWDPGNKYTMAWQSGWTAVAYNKTVVTDPGDSIQLLFDAKYAGRIGMLNDPIEAGSVGLLAVGIDPASSTESDWAKAARKLSQQKSDGLVANYYDSSYITALELGDIVISQCYSGDIFQANLSTGTGKDLVLLLPEEGAMLWTDNMCIPLHAQNPLDAMTAMDYYYSPVTQSVVEYYNDYVCPVPDTAQQLLDPTGWNVPILKEMRSEIGLPASYTAHSPEVFPGPAQIKRSHNYYDFKSQEEIDAWYNLFQPIVSGA